ncbi:anhydro-N-acetylmuramic acid kinase [Hanstruepera marina]|uniref:anhydro-N-acetylmuramic acid kinase n=1 Tax=Hanstruepera marina TaxID=2873265 RepID=UPI001CA631B2|nr:anhydro-N-acetylmuramic acid kinase [Hanstruepera marina]
MIKSEYFVVGCMSGTSLDGLDLAYIRFFLDKKWNFEIIQVVTVPYSEEWKNDKLKALVTFSVEELKDVDEEYTELLADNINNFISQNNIANLDAICSHGHTALHQPEIGLTYQIGNLRLLSKLTQKTVVCDFRKQDVEFNGQGAPLVPIGDRLLFSEYDFCLNLGGFANISFEQKGRRIAFDICPANIVLNHYVGELGLEYDPNGENASRGLINESLLNKLNKLQYYKQNHPKSLGLEWVENNIYPLIDSYNLDAKTILRTFVEHIAVQIVSAFNEIPKSSVLVSGGGAYNSFLIDLLKSKSSNKIVIPSQDILEYKEALIFGLLGVLKLRNEINCLASVTGAEKNHSSGEVYQP